MNRKIKILFITETKPFSKNNGVNIKINNVLRCLSELFSVTCVCIIRNETEGSDRKISRETDYDLRFIKATDDNNKYIRMINSYRWATCGRIFLFKKIRRGLNSIINEIQPDVVWLEYGFIGQHIPFIKKYNLPVIFVTHNAQAKLYLDKWMDMRLSSRKLFELPFVIANFMQERLFLNTADRLIAITENDKCYYMKFISKEKIDVLPNFQMEQDIERAPRKNINSNYICMIGGLNGFQNYNGAIFFIKNIWPIVKGVHNDLLLYLIGALPEYSLKMKELENTIRESAPGIVLEGQVDDGVPYVKAALLSVVPIFSGSGIRTKIIESAACRTPVVSTSIGVKGLPFVDGESILIADSIPDFADRINLIIEDSNLRDTLVENAYKIFDKNYSFKINKQKIKRLVENVFYQGIEKTTMS